VAGLDADMDRATLYLILAVLGIASAGLSWVLARSTQRLAMRLGAIDEPKGGRKIHEVATPLFGGLGIGLVILIAFGFLSPWLSVPSLALAGLLVATLILLFGGIMDDRYDLPAKYQILFSIAASAVAVLCGLSISHLTNPFGGTFSLQWMTVGGFALLPSLLAFFWLMGVTYATKVMDGLDGLVTGQAVIGAVLIAALALTQRYYQPSMAMLAIVVAGAFIGFLPHNSNPAKQFLGEAGSTLAGFLLGALAILSGAKLATALMVLGLPIADLAFVLAGRIHRGVSPFKGDDTHLHHKLLKAGLDKRHIVYLLWSLTALAGAAGLFVQTRGKALLFFLLCAVTAGLSAWADAKSKTKALL
jgi:UDP-GlcNAc:undecaprenyl-phosphate GlcNAc-1-phosphate transferase